MTVQRKRIWPKGAKNGFVAFFCSLLIPGAGDWYCGRIGRGFATFLFVGFLDMITLGLAVIVLHPLAAIQSAVIAGGIARCPFCQGQMSDKALRCPHCAQEMYEGGTQPTAAAPAAPPSAGLVGCGCGAVNQAGARFCHACGTPLPQPATP